MSNKFPLDLSPAEARALAVAVRQSIPQAKGTEFGERLERIAIRLDKKIRSDKEKT